jgi:Fe-S cluster assembly protein SufD
MAVPARQSRSPSAFDGGVEALFASLKDSLPGSEWMQKLRVDALARFVQVGLPHRRVEWWKYTDLGPRVEASLVTARPTPGTARPRIAISPSNAIEVELSEGQVTRLPHAGLPDGLEVMALRDELAVPSLWLRPWLQPGAGAIENLNLAFATDGVLIRAGRGCKIAQPITIRSWLSTPGAMAHVRNVVELEEGAELTLIEIDQTGADRQSFATSRTSFDLATGAILHHIRIIAGAVSAITIRSDAIELGVDADYRGLMLTGGPGLSRQDMTVRLSGEGARYDVACGYAVGSGQLADVSQEVLHAAPRTVSRILAKGIASGSGHGVVQGRVHVTKDAQQTDSHQLARGLMLTPGAEIDHRPELEIYADDVKCGHGAAVGSLDDSQLFYLKSRGIPAEEARNLLVGAYFAELTARSPEDLREHLEAWIAANMTRAAGVP